MIESDFDFEKEVYLRLNNFFCAYGFEFYEKIVYGEGRKILLFWKNKHLHIQLFYDLYGEINCKLAKPMSREQNLNWYWLFEYFPLNVSEKSQLLDFSCSGFEESHLDMIARKLINNYYIFENNCGQSKMKC